MALILLFSLSLSLSHSLSLSLSFSLRKNIPSLCLNYSPGISIIFSPLFNNFRKFVSFHSFPYPLSSSILFFFNSSSSLSRFVFPSFQFCYILSLSLSITDHRPSFPSGFISIINLFFRASSFTPSSFSSFFSLSLSVHHERVEWTTVIPTVEQREREREREIKSKKKRRDRERAEEDRNWTNWYPSMIVYWFSSLSISSLFSLLSLSPPSSWKRSNWILSNHNPTSCLKHESSIKQDIVYYIGLSPLSLSFSFFLPLSFHQYPLDINSIWISRSLSQKRQIYPSIPNKITNRIRLSEREEWSIEFPVLISEWIIRTGQLYSKWSMNHSYWSTVFEMVKEKESRKERKREWSQDYSPPSSVMMTTDAEGPSPAGLNAWMEMVYSVNVFNPWITNDWFDSNVYQLYIVDWIWMQKILLFQSPDVQKFDISDVQKFDISDVQKFDISDVQKFSCSLWPRVESDRWFVAGFDVVLYWSGWFVLAAKWMTIRRRKGCRKLVGMLQGWWG